ncbi:related to CYB2-lactate dehydrogenase cytochrome b2 [Phialocephala subalpina]|uniref:Related to CYB2-lactate dehydrogenase cytochrome b2 n=1 Tax=Phialocephala subalpina TaxID=576137 RepID=A0A1L7X5F8_9HELO|nr:related to CYB2-lactate dehydrogenase cytochrome b2 [Phialocephala subalpina]
MSGPAKLRLSDVSNHNTDDDGWIIINGIVWDVTGFVTQHPGGPQVIQEHLGKDASEVYNEIHGPGLISTLGEAKRIGECHEIPPKKELTSISKDGDKAKQSAGSPKPDLRSIINITQFKNIARPFLKERAWGYMSGATEDGFTHRANPDFYRRIMFRPRILRAVSKVDTKIPFLGEQFAMPIFIAPTSSVKLSHQEGEVGMAIASVASGVAPVVPTMSSYAISEVVDAMPAGYPFFFQLYVQQEHSETEKRLREAAKLGARAVMVTIDLPVLSKRESQEPPLSSGDGYEAKPSQLTPPPSNMVIDADLVWADIGWIRKVSGLPVFLKGIQCAADARRAVDVGCAGIWLSNHGGRALDTAQPAILTLLEIQANCPEILSQVEVVVDGGIRRGSDVLKAYCLGASAVCIGRSFLYALAAYGHEGVIHAFKILKEELELAMQLVGITSLDQAHPGLLNTADLDTLVYKGDEHPFAKKVVRTRARASKL